MSWCLRHTGKSLKIVVKLTHKRIRNNYASEKEMLFASRCSSQEISEDFEKLSQFILIEGFKRSIPHKIKVHLDEQHFCKLSEAATIADDFALTHKSVFRKM